MNIDNIKLEPAKLRKYLELEDIKFKLKEAIEARDTNKIVDLIILYVSIAISVSVDEVESINYKDISNLLISIEDVNKKHIDLPFLLYSGEKREKGTIEYEGRSWWLWAFRFAERFHWSLEYIANLTVEDAMKLYQEYLIDEYENMSWQWMLSERFIGYDTATKKSKAIPLSKPQWMMGKPKEVKKVKIRKDMLPVGKVITYNDFIKPTPSD